jgi:uncharacterized membrane protein YhaH (DUF805 family)
MGYMFLPLKRYADFSGRSRRKEFWSWTLLNIIIIGGLMTFMVIMFASAAARSTVSYSSYSSSSSYSYEANIDPVRFIRNLGGLSLVAFGLLMLWSIATFIPGLAVAVRRLHDTNRSGWMYLINFIPLVGPFIFIVFCFMEGTRGPNYYGPDPKGSYFPGGHQGGYPPPAYGGHPQPYGAPPPYGGHPHPGGPPYGGGYR